MPVEVLPWLYLSSEYHCLVHGRGERLDEIGATHLLSVNAMLPEQIQKIKTKLQHGLLGSSVQHHGYIAARDQEGYNVIEKHWDECRQFLLNVKTGYDEQKQQVTCDGDNENGAATATSKVVVHCVAGQNRSALIVCAALIDLEGWSLLRAVRHVKQVRGILFTNVSFRLQLCQLAERCNRLGELPPHAHEEV